MAELKLGNKYECYNCEVKFYDLGKTKPICPQCGADQKAAEEGEPPLVTQATRREKSIFAELDDEDEELGDLGDDLDDEDLEVDEELEGADLEDDEEAKEDTEDEGED